MKKPLRITSLISALLLTITLLLPGSLVLANEPEPASASLPQSTVVSLADTSVSALPAAESTPNAEPPAKAEPASSVQPAPDAAPAPVPAPTVLPAEAEEPVAQPAAATEITILHTNDVHARVGVEPYVATLKSEYQTAGKNVLLLSAGDVLHGQPIATLPRGQSIVDIMNATGYDAMSPGNHDFNYGSARLLELAASMNFPVLAANVVDKTTTNPVLTPYTTKTFGSVKVGIFGLATPETVTKTNPLNVSTLNFTDPATVAAAMVTQLRDVENCDVVIALVHLGLDTATLPAERSTAVAAVPGIDLVVDGHSHTKLENGQIEAGMAPIVQAYQYGESIGEVTLSVADDANSTVSLLSASLHNVSSQAGASPITYAGITPDATVQGIITAANAANAPFLNEVVATTTVLLDGLRANVRTRETNLANLITTAMLRDSGADVAITNGGGIRDSIPAGDVKVSQILTVLPFGNYVVTREVSGANIKKAVEFGLTSYPAAAGGFPQIAGFSVVFDPAKPAGQRVLRATLADGTPLVDETVYTLATNDFMAAGGDGYTMLATGGLMAFNSLEDALIEYLQTNPAISADPAGRVTVYTPATGITLNKTTLALAAGKSETLTPLVAPANASFKEVTWASSNAKVAKVDAAGKVTATGKGTANITATADGQSTTCKITTSQPVTSVTFGSVGYTLTGKGKTAILRYTASPANANNKTVTWKSLSPKIVTVNSKGVVTAKVASGKAVITATAKDGSGKQAKITVYIGTRVSKVTLNKTELTIKAGKTTTLKATLAPAKASYRKIAWTSSNTKTATVDANGKVKALRAGTVTITAKATDGSGKKVTCKITITK